MTTASEARATIEAYLRDERPRVHVVAMQEDATDYFAELRCDGPWLLGESFLFVSKATGELWHGHVGHLDKIDSMTKTGP